MTSITKRLGQTTVTVNRRDDPEAGPNDNSIYIVFDDHGVIEESDLSIILAMVAKIKEL